MIQYIDKSALVAEIEKIIDTLIKNSGYIGAFGENQITVYEDVIHLINSLELKEVDLEKEIKRYRMNNPIIGHREESLYDYMVNVAKHFFELGLKAQKGEEV